LNYRQSKSNVIYIREQKIMSKKSFFLGFAGAVLAATTLIDVAPGNTNPVRSVRSVSGNSLSGSSGSPTSGYSSSGSINTSATGNGASASASGSSNSTNNNANSYFYGGSSSGNVNNFVNGATSAQTGIGTPATGGTYSGAGAGIAVGNNGIGSYSSGGNVSVVGGAGNATAGSSYTGSNVPPSSSLLFR
jgi:hypothetical protein